MNDVQENPSSHRWRILITAPALAPEALELLAERGCDVTLLGSAVADRDEELRHRLETQPFDAIISRTYRLTAESFDACPTVRVVARHGVGYNNVDIAAAAERGIPVYIAAGTNAASVAELTIGHLLAAARRIPWLDSELRQGRWTRFQGGTQLGGRTLGVIGFGAIGQRVARAALGLGMRVSAFDPVLDVSAAMPEAIACASLDELLSQSHAITVHVPENPHTIGLIGDRELSLLPKGAIVVNTARSPIIDEDALIAALRDGRVSAAGLDLTHDAPLAPGHPYLGLESVSLTPHIGGSTTDALSAVAVLAATNAVDYLEGNAPSLSLCVNPESLKKIASRS